MKSRLITLVALCIILLVNCSLQEKRLDLLEIDLKNDWNKISKSIKVKQGLCNTSEYLYSYFTKNVSTFKISEFALLTEKTINTSALAIPTENQVSFIFKDSTRHQLIEIETEIALLDNDSTILNLITKKYGKGELLSKKGSINQLKGIQNYLWKNLGNNQALILSTFLEGNIYDAEKKKSIKQYKCRMYLIDNNAEISYPNGQKENILERLMKQKSQ